MAVPSRNISQQARTRALAGGRPALDVYCCDSFNQTEIFGIQMPRSRYYAGDDSSSAAQPTGDGGEAADDGRRWTFAPGSTMPVRGSHPILVQSHTHTCRRTLHINYDSGSGTRTFENCRRERGRDLTTPSPFDRVSRGHIQNSCPLRQELRGTSPAPLINSALEISPLGGVRLSLRLCDKLPKLANPVSQHT